MALMDPSYTKEQKEFAIRRSLTGSAARLVMYQGHDKPIDKILDVLDSALVVFLQLSQRYSKLVKILYHIVFMSTDVLKFLS
jgi:hypothetical protein